MRGKSPFGVQGPPSNAVEAKGKTPVLTSYPFITTLTEVNGKFQITWTFPDSLNTQIQGFQLLRSDDGEGGFTPVGSLLGAATRMIEDPAPSPLSNYYKIEATDLSDNKLESVAKLGQMNDTQPPAAPGGLQASIDDKGLVTLQWNANTEPDLKGYRVFFSNHPNDDYAQITAEVLNATTMTHQLETQLIGKKAYYRMLATDFRENDSPFSAVASVRRPDVVPPSNPVLTKAEAMADGVHLAWIFSTSDDVARHALQRKAQGSTDWENLAIFPVNAANDTLRIDSTTTGIFTYTYRIMAFDSTGLMSASTMIEVKPVRNNLDTIRNFKAERAADGAQKQAKLSWAYPKDNPVGEFHIYRSIGTGQPYYYATLKTDPATAVVDPVTQCSILIYRDKEIATGKTYRYQVLAKYLEGSSSPLSRVLNFQY
jgi:uncharacterized protein